MTDLNIIPFQKILDALLDVETPFPPRYLYRFSDLEAKDIKQLASLWAKVPAWRRKALMEDLQELSEKDTLLSFEAIGCQAVNDPDPEVRLAAVLTLWEYDEPGLASIFLRMLKNDPDIAVRAAAASGLGQFVLLGEFDKISSKKLSEIEDALLAAIEGDDELQVRRSSLESIGYSSRSEVPALIQASYESGNKEWMSSALLAMGRSGDDERWEPQVLAMLHSKLPMLRAEAARAAGELELTSAANQLIELLDDVDEETRLASIWSLSQIGGEGVRQAMEHTLSLAEDDDDIAYIESALDNLLFNEGIQSQPILTFPDPDEAEDDEEDLDEAFMDLLEDDLDWLEDDGEELND